MSNPFIEELNYIKNEEVKNFTEFVVEKRPSYFDEVPSSSTGKYHSPQSNGYGGLMRHTKAVVYFAVKLCDVYNLAPIDRDVVISACILHDIVKYGIGVKQPFTTKNHDTEGAKYVQILAKTAPPCKYVEEICKGISAHMGRWKAGATVVFPKDLTEIEQIVHLADVISSCKEVRLGFLEPETLIG